MKCNYGKTKEGRIKILSVHNVTGQRKKIAEKKFAKIWPVFYDCLSFRLSLWLIIKNTALKLVNYYIPHLTILKSICKDHFEISPCFDILGFKRGTSHNHRDRIYFFVLVIVEVRVKVIVEVLKNTFQ